MLTQDEINAITARLAECDISQDFPWYYASFGEKCYCFGTFEAIPRMSKVPFPPTCELVPHENLERVWVAEDGTEMLLEDFVASIERQCGYDVCKFIAHSRDDVRDLLTTVNALLKWKSEAETLLREHLDFHDWLSYQHGKIADSGLSDDIREEGGEICGQTILFLNGEMS